MKELDCLRSDALKAELAYWQSVIGDRVGANDRRFGDMVQDLKEALEFAAPQPSAPLELRPVDAWHEDMGDVLWWRIEKDGTAHEAPWVGTPLCCGYTVEAHTTTRIITQLNQDHDPEPKIERIDVGGWIEDYYTHFSDIPRPTCTPCVEEPRS